MTLEVILTPCLVFVEKQPGNTPANIANLCPKDCSGNGDCIAGMFFLNYKIDAGSTFMCLKQNMVFPHSNKLPILEK